MYILHTHFSDINLAIEMLARVNLLKPDKDQQGFANVSFVRQKP
jgi:hypothetical protein